MSHLFLLKTTIFCSCTNSLSVVFIGGNENVVCFFSGVLTYDLKSKYATLIQLQKNGIYGYRRYLLIFILNCVAVQSGYIYHHTIICFSEVQISFNTLFSIFVDYNSLFNVFTNGIIRRSNGFSRWWGN